MASLTDREIDQLKPILFRCLQSAGQNLSQMLGKEIQVSPPMLSTFGVSRIPYIFGGSQKIVSGIYMGFGGHNLPENSPTSYDGHLLLTFNIESAYELATILTEGLNVPLDKINGMTDSIFSEIGNVFGTSFITAMANIIGVRIMPTVPTVINYRATAILEYLKSSMKRKDGDVLLIQTQITADERSVEGKFFLIPEDYTSLLTLIKKPA